MSTEKIYESRRTENYATGGYGQVVSRRLFAVIEQGDMPLDSGFGEAEIIEAEPSTVAQSDVPDQASVRVRIDTVPQDTIATSPDAAAEAAATMLGLSKDDGQLNFRVEYPA